MKIGYSSGVKKNNKKKIKSLQLAVKFFLSFNKNENKNNMTIHLLIYVIYVIVFNNIHKCIVYEIKYGNALCVNVYKHTCAIYIYMGKCMSNILNFEENIYCDLYPRICIYIYIYIYIHTI